ncbi:aspartic peptidase domain-containing protein [Aspergillus nidulans var. acristatus]
MVSTEYGTVFDVEATIGGQTFQLLVDFSSCDLCDLTRTYNVSDTYEEISHQIFGIEYGAGVASGAMAFEGVTVAGVSVPRQRIAVANKSTPMGDGVNSGLLGLGGPSPCLGGYLSLGELPPVAHSDSWAVALVEMMNNIPLNFTSNRRTRSYRATTLSASLGSNSTSTNSSSAAALFQAFFDSGYPLSCIPSRIADPLNNLFSPAGVYNRTLQAYEVDCDAKAASSFNLDIDRQTFTHDVADRIYQTAEDVCISAIGNSTRSNCLMISKM